MNKSLSLSIFFIFLIFITISNSDTSQPRCVAQNRTTDPIGFVISCDFFGYHGEDDRSMDQVLQELSYHQNGGLSIFSEIAPTIEIIQLSRMRGNLTITGDAFRFLPKLIRLDIESRPGWHTTAFYTWLDISPRAFESTKNLTEIRLKEFYLTDDTLKALESLRSQLRKLEFDHCLNPKLDEFKQRFYPSRD